MTVASKQETLGFQTEAKQLLHLMIHSLYSNKEIFLRELVSNASDAIDKLRFESLSDDSLIKEDPNLRIRVDFDADAKTITFSDNGIGMSREEVIANLGTIAKSGTADFLKKLSGDDAKDSQLIGQFGVGFYSSFIVADKVEVMTRRAGNSADEGVHWTSEGEAEFTIENIEKNDRGTTIILHLKGECEEFADQFRLKSIINKYADHLSVPVEMLKPQDPKEGDEDKDIVDVPEYEAINSAKALWTRSRSEVTDDEYKEFYRHVSHDFEEPLSWSHNKVEGKLEYTSLLYLPKNPPFDLWNREAPKGLKLYVQRVFIMDQAEQFLPLYLRFLRGVIDSNDLSLNVSREILQKDPAVDSMKSALTKRVLDMLDKMAKKEPEKYQTFWDNFGEVIKEGPAEDHANKEKIAKLFRFSTTHRNSATQDQSLTGYIERMKEGQEKIYYIVADSFNAASSNPHLEIFKKKGIEVIMFYDRIDEWVMGQMYEFDGKQFQDISKGDLDLGKLDDEEDKESKEKAEKELEGLMKRVSDQLEGKVEEVRVTHRLTDSPACVVVPQDQMGGQMRKIMEAAGQAVPESKPIFELNPDHALVQKLDKEDDEALFADLVSILFDQAKLVAGEAPEDTADFVKRINKLLMS